MGFQVKDPKPGEWKLYVRPERVTKVAHYRLFVFSRNPHLSGGLITPSHLCQPGIPMLLRYRCYYDHPITGSGLSVICNITMPDGESSSFKLRDDGDREHGDLRASDGLFSAVFTNTRKPGMYSIDVTVTSDGYPYVYYAKDGGPPNEDDERSRVPNFRRTYKRTVGVGKAPFKVVACDPNKGYPGDKLLVTLKGEQTHFKQNSTTVTFGEGIDVGEVEVIDKYTDSVPVYISEEAPYGYREVTVNTHRYGETIEVEGGFQVVEHRSGCAVRLERFWKLIRALFRQGLAFVDDIHLTVDKRNQS